MSAMTGRWMWLDSFTLVVVDSEEPVLEIGVGYDGLWGGETPSEADASLIAAAPDLLAALKAMPCAWCERPAVKDASDCPHCVQAKAAIAKAEGL